MTGKQNINIHAADIVIIGAGIAGLTAALHLIDDARAHGKTTPSITILEAGAHVGGRVKSIELGNGMRLDEGAAWFHDGGRNGLIDFAHTRYGAALGTMEEDAAQNRIWVTGGKYSADVREVALAQLDEAYREWKTARPHEDIALGKLVTMCLEKHNNVQTRAFANYMARAWKGLDSPNEVSFDEFYKDPTGAGGCLLQDGASRIIACMADELRACGVTILTGTAVASVKNTPLGVEVATLTKTVYRAAKAVVTASIGVLKSGIIAFDADVKDKVDSYIGGLVMADMAKIGVPLREGFLESCAIKPNSFISVLNADPMFLCHAGTGGKPVLTLFMGGRSGTGFEGMSRSQLRQCAQAFLDRIPELDGYRDHMDGDPHVTTWNSNVFTQGAFSSALPGSRRQDPLAAGNIVFAGEAFVADPKNGPGQMAGAWYSGKTAAGMIANGMKTLNKNRDEEKNLNIVEFLPRVPATQKNYRHEIVISKGESL